MKYVKILGVKDYPKTNMLRQTTEQALRQLNLDFQIDEINEIEQILNFKIRGIPALYVDGRVVAQKSIPSVNELIAHFQKFQWFNEKLNFPMSNILFPTDFSPASKNAFLFAIEIAKVFDSELQVVHCFTPIIDPNQPLVVQPLQENEAIAEDKLKKFIAISPEQLASESGKKINITYSTRMGFAADEIVNLTKSGSCDFVIMSTTGHHGLLDKVFGTVSAAVSVNAFCPVLLVPDGVSFSPFKHILFAANKDSSSPEAIKRIINFANIFSASIHFVNIYNEKSPQDDQIQETLLNEMFQNVDPGISFDFTSVSSTDPLSGIDEYAQKRQIDLAVFVTKHRNFWENLMHRSQTKRMAIHTKTPLLVLHLNDL